MEPSGVSTEDHREGETSPSEVSFDDRLSAIQARVPSLVNRSYGDWRPETMQGLETMSREELGDATSMYENRTGECFGQAKDANKSRNRCIRNSREIDQQIILLQAEKKQNDDAAVSFGKTELRALEEGAVAQEHHYAAKYLLDPNAPKPLDSGSMNVTRIQLFNAGSIDWDEACWKQFLRDSSRKKIVSYLNKANNLNLVKNPEVVHAEVLTMKGIATTEVLTNRLASYVNIGDPYQTAGRRWIPNSPAINRRNRAEHLLHRATEQLLDRDTEAEQDNGGGPPAKKAPLP